MSIAPDLRASARATYRLLFRTAATTFNRDERVLNAFRDKVRTEFREGRTLSDTAAYTARIKLGREVADVLRKNVVQGVKVSHQTSQDGDGVWQLRLSKDTELGSNESIKSSPRAASGGGRGSSGCSQSSASSASAIPSLSPPPASPPEELTGILGSLWSKCEHDEMLWSDCIKAFYETFVERGRSTTTTTSTIITGDPPSEIKAEATESEPKPKKKPNFSVLKKLSQIRTKPELNESDLEESFVRGSGPGGQSINKTSNNVQLLHKPTGIRTTCQETRSLQTNRIIARRNLLEKLDRIANPGLSKEDLKRAKQVERERRRRKKSKKKKAQAKGEVDAADSHLSE